MSKISYLLRPTSKRSKEAPVSVVHRHPGADFVQATEVTVRPEWFNAKTGRVKTSDPASVEKNSQIQAVVTQVEQAVREVLAKGLEPNRAAVRAEFDGYRRIVAIVEAEQPADRAYILDVVGKLEQEIKELEAALETKRRHLAKAQEYGAFWGAMEVPKPATLFVNLIQGHVEINKHYSIGWKRTMSHLIKIIADYNPQLRLEDITLQTLHEIQDFQVKAEYRNNSVRSFMGKINSLYRDFAEEAGLDTKFLRKFKGLKELKDDNPLFLTPEQLNELEGLQLGRVQHEVREQFLFLCEVGIRQQDISKITRADVQLTEFKSEMGEVIQRYELSVVMQKVPKPVRIPLSTRALALLESNSFQFKEIVNTYFNRILKALCKKTSFAMHLHKVTNYVGNKPEKEDKPYYRAISAHAGRRTFINTCMLNGVSQSTVAVWVGHKDLEMIHKHYSHKDIQAAAEAYKVPYKAR